MKLPSPWNAIPKEITRRLGKERSGRQRAMVADGHLLLILHKVPTCDEQQRVGAFFWRQPLETWGSDKEGKWESTSRGPGLAALHYHIESYKLATENYSDLFERADSAEDYFNVLQSVAPVHHAAGSMFNALQAAREGIPQDQDIIDMRDKSYDIERTLSLLYANTKTALDYHIAKQAEHHALLAAESVRREGRLNTLAAIFFPLMAIAGIFGMNLRSGLEERSLWAFWLTFLSGGLLGFIVDRWARRKGT